MPLLSGYSILKIFKLWHNGQESVTSDKPDTPKNTISISNQVVICSKQSIIRLGVSLNGVNQDLHSDEKFDTPYPFTIDWTFMII